MFETVDPVVENFVLLGVVVGVVVEFVHLVVVHFNVSGKVRAPSFVHTDLLTELSIL